MNTYKAIKRVLTTEKGGLHAQHNKYVFEVDRKANKINIKKAVEEIYNVKVKGVTTIKIASKPRRLRQWQPGKTASGKKAIVTLKDGYKIE